MCLFYEVVRIGCDDQLFVGGDHGHLDLRVGGREHLVHAARSLVGGLVEVYAHEFEPFADRFAHLGRVLAHAAREDDQIDAAHLGRIFADELLVYYITIGFANLYLLMASKMIIAGTLYTAILWLSGSVTFKESLHYMIKK